MSGKSLSLCFTNGNIFFNISQDPYHKYKSEKLQGKAAKMNGKPLGPEWKLEHGDEKGVTTKI